MPRGDTRSIRMTNEMVGRGELNAGATAPEPWIPASQEVDGRRVRSKQSYSRFASSRELGGLRWG